MLWIRGCIRITGISVLTLALASCDIGYGIYGSTIVQGPANDTCVLATLKQATGVRNVQVQSVKNQSVAILGDQVLDGSLIRYFTYDIGGIYAPTLMVEEYSGGRLQFSSTMLSMNEKIPKDELDRALPVMQEVEQAVSRACGFDLKNVKHTVAY